jgi:hypothetical protein
MWVTMKDTGNTTEGKVKPTTGDEMYADSSEFDWSKRIMRQGILVSRIAAEILKDTGRANWNENCYEECGKLLLQETTPLKDIFADRGTKNISVLVDQRAQQWLAEALEKARHASTLVGDCIAEIGVRNPDEAGQDRCCSGPAAEQARRAVLDAAESEPLSDSQMERLLRAALVKMS